MRPPRRPNLPFSAPPAPNPGDEPRAGRLMISPEAGTPGRALLDGAKTFRAYGWEVPVRARLERLDALSAHADRGEMLRWLGGFTEAPKRTFLVHGEPEARKALEIKVRAELAWNVHRPGMHERVELT